MSNGCVGRDCRDHIVARGLVPRSDERGGHERAQWYRTFQATGDKPPHYTGLEDIHGSTRRSHT